MQLGFERIMGNLLTMVAALCMSWTHHAQALPLTVDPESIVPLPETFDIETPAPDVPPEIALFHGAWVGTWGDDIRLVLVVERVRPDGRAGVVFAHGDSAFNGTYREWWRSEAKIVDGALTIAGEAMKIPWLRTLSFVLDGPERLFQTASSRSGAVSSGNWLVPTWHGFLRSIARLNGPDPVRARGFRTLRSGHRTARGRSCSKRRCTGLPDLLRHRSRSSLTDPTPAAIS